MKSGPLGPLDLKQVRSSSDYPDFTTFYYSYFSQGVYLLGFKDNSELLFEDNVKHSTFVYPDEDVSDD